MRFITRDGWGSRATNRTAWPGAMAELFIHHTAGTWTTSEAQDMSTMRSLQAYAIDSKGYSDIDYNLVIGSVTGNILEGRGGGYKSGATKDRNDISRSICVMGNFETKVPTDNSLEAIVLAAQLMIDAGQLAPNTTVKVYGHQQNPAHPGATACPGRNLQAVVPELARMIAGGGVPAPGPDPGPLPPPTGDDEMLLVVALDANGTAWVGNGVTKVRISDEDVFARYCMVFQGRFVNTSQGQVNGWEDVAQVDDKTIATLGVG